MLGNDTSQIEKLIKLMTNQLKYVDERKKQKENASFTIEVKMTENEARELLKELQDAKK